MNGSRKRRGRPFAATVAAAMVVLALLPPPAALAQTAATPGTTRLSDLGYNDDTLRGRSFSSNYFLPGPKDYPLASSGSTLELVYSATSLAGPKSSMSISWNGVPVGDLPLTGAQDRKQATVALPADRIDPAVNRLDITGDLDIDTGACQNDASATHVTIFKETAVHYALTDSQPHPALVDPDLARYPAPFFDSTPSVGSQLAFVLPANPSSDVLQATATLAIGFGRTAGSRRIDLSVTNDTGKLPESLAPANIIYVGEAKDLPSLRDVQGLPVSIDADGNVAKDGTPVATDDGVLAEAPSPLNPGRMVLAVTGQSRVAVVRAAATLGTRRTARLLGGSSAIVDAFSASTTASEQQVSGRRVVTLADLGRVDETVNGIGDHTITFKLELPGVPQGGNGLALNLVTSHSPLIDAGNSSMRLTLNGVPLDSVGLKGTDQTHNVKQIRLPTSSLRSGVNEFNVTFSLRLSAQPTGVCGSVPGEQAWAVLHSDTSVQLPSQFGTATGSDLAGYPYPFLASNGLAKTAFVVPDELNADPFIRYCADLGRSLGQDSLPLAVIAARDFQPGQSDVNLIIWGTPQQNPVLGQLKDALPLAITPGQAQRYAFANSVLLSVKDSSKLGVIQELTSPWTPGRQILVISGTTPDAIALAVAGLAQTGLANNLALVSAAPPPSVTTLAPPLGSPPAVDITTYKVTPKQQTEAAHSAIELLPVAMAAGLGLLALLMAASMAYEAFVREPRNRR